MYSFRIQITLDIPEAFAAQIVAADKDPVREALEVLAVEGYRTRQLTESQVRCMLGFIMCMQVHELLAAHDVCLTTPLPTSRPMPKPPGTCERFALSVATVETPP